MTGGTRAVVDETSSQGLGVGVFLSAVSNEFQNCRALVGADLRAKQLEVRIQDEFRQGDDGTTLERLHTYIEGCSTVVCLVGRRSGSIPPLKAALPFLTRYGPVLPEDIEQPSYTQWELIFANTLEKRVLIYHAAPTRVPDDPEPAIDHPDLQARFVRWVFDDLGLNRGNFASDDEAGRLVLREDWPVPAAQGPTVRATVARSGLRAVEDPASRLQIRARNSPTSTSLSSDRYELRGRDSERSHLELFLNRARDQVIEVVGPEGVGKKKLLAQFEGDHDTTWTDPADGDRIDDLVQSAWEHLHGTPASTVLPHRRDRQLRALEALVFAADVDHVDQLRHLIDAMPKAQFCVTATRRITDAGRTLEVKNLGAGQEPAMLEIFTDHYLRPVPEELHPEIIEICRSHRGNPAEIVQLARNAERAVSLDAWLAENRPLSASELTADATPEGSDHDPVQVIECVGERVPRDVLLATTSPAATEAAEARCRILRSSPRYRTSPMVRTTDPDPVLMADVLEHTVTWSTVAGATEIFQNRAFVLTMMDWGVEHQHWSEVLEIGRNAEMPMALGGRHDAWKRVLDDSLVAACAIGDRAAEGWALHQLGSRSLLREDHATARVELAQAHAVRQDVDPEGAELSRGNLRLVPGAVVPLAAILFGIALALVFTISLVVSAKPEPGIVDITPEVWRLDEVPAEGDQTQKQFTITNVGPVDIRFDEDGPLETNDAAEFKDVEQTCTELRDGKWLPPDDHCTLTIRYVGDGLPAPRFVEIQLRTPGGIEGDQGILVIPRTPEGDEPAGG